MPDSAPDADHADADADAGLDAIAEHLYGLVPDDFVPARDDAVAQARERGDRDLARAIGRLRRPTRAAWLANLLARHRAEQLEGLVLLSADLGAAQRTLDGDALRALSSQRHRLVAAMAREAGRLARERGVPAGDALLRELQGILEAALADPAVATEVRSGRLTRTVTYSGFGPGADPGAVPAPARRDPRPPEPGGPDPDRSDPGRSAADRREQERRAAEQERRERDLAAAEREEAAARDQQDMAEAARDDAEADHGAARERVATVAAELDAAREQERAAAARARAATATAKDAARAAGAAAARAARARARLDE